MYSWGQARRALLFGHSIRLSYWPEGMTVSQAIPGQRSSPYILSSSEGVLDEDWVPDRKDLNRAWVIIEVKQDLYWEVPF